MSEAAVNARRSYAELYAHAAMSSIENWIDLPEPATHLTSTAEGPTRWSSLHPDLPRKLESILALVLLGIYELCQRGNLSKMRARANQALTTAVDLSIHTADPDESGCSDAQSRAWWMTVSLPALTSGYPTHRLIAWYRCFSVIILRSSIIRYVTWAWKLIHLHPLLTLQLTQASALSSSSMTLGSAHRTQYFVAVLKYVPPPTFDYCP